MRSRPDLSPGRGVVVEDRALRYVRHVGCRSTAKTTDNVSPVSVARPRERRDTRRRRSSRSPDDPEESDPAQGRLPREFVDFLLLMDGLLAAGAPDLSDEPPPYGRYRAA